MREIKFRGFSSDLNKWVYGDLLHLERDFVRYHSIIDWSNKVANVRVEDNSTGQYTGLKDKNGKEIYEGDIIESHRTYRYEIVFENTKFVCYHIGERKNTIGRWGDLSRITDADFLDWEFEVIGNIHEHKHLLQ